jgi:hypothetical protein
MFHVRQCKGRRDTDEKLLGLQVKCPSLVTDFNQTCTVWSAYVGSARCDISVTPLQRKERYEKLIRHSRIKWASLLADFNQTCTVWSAYVGSARCDVSVTPLQRKERYEKLIRHPRIKWASLLPISTKLVLFVAHVLRVLDVILDLHHFKGTRDTDEKTTSALK